MDSPPVNPVNKVADSGLLTLDLAQLVKTESIDVLDISPFLYKGLVLREKEFRQSLAQFNFAPFNQKYVLITCTADALIPHWAYMLVASKVKNHCKDFVIGKEADINQLVIRKTLQAQIDTYQGQRIVVKGCHNEEIPLASYADVISILQPVAKSIFFGEPCSTVPIYKKQKKQPSS